MLLFIEIKRGLCRKKIFISKHLMLLFISFYKPVLFRMEISKHLMLLFIQDPHSISSLSLYFKTSHVIVYPPAGTIILRSSAYFKTSHVIVYLQPPDQQHSFHHHFKTSHVIVYPDALESYKRTLDHFKTSHVIVYHFRHRLIPTFRLISKHLMLLFISSTKQ